MGVESILEKELGYTIWDSRPKIRLKVQCSCGKQNTIRKTFDSWNRRYFEEGKCKKCGEPFYIEHSFSQGGYEDKYEPRIIKK
jgi:hypothetical protein